MKAFAIQLGGKSGDYIKTIPSNRPEEPHLGRLDIALAAVSFLCVLGLIYLLIG